MGRIKTAAVVLTPVAPAAVPNGALYMDSGGGNAISSKSATGSAAALASAGVVAQSFIKTMQNLSGVTIPANTQVAKKPDGSIVAADSDGVGTQVVIGITLAQITHNATGNVHTIGPNVAGCITGLGFAPGDPVYLSETGGYTNSLASFTGDNDTIVRVGFADCAAGAASATATDLILFSEVVAVAP